MREWQVLKIVYLAIVGFFIAWVIFELFFMPGR